VEFRILGPIEAEEHGLKLDLGGLRERALLARLLLSANRVVSADHTANPAGPRHGPWTGNTANPAGPDQARLNGAREAAAAALGEEAFRAAFQAGLRMSAEQAVALAKDGSWPPTTPARPA